MYEDYDRRPIQGAPSRTQTMRPPQPLPPMQHPRIPPPRPTDAPLISLEEGTSAVMYGLHAEIRLFYVDLFIVMSFQFYKAIRAFCALLTNQKLTRLPFFKFPAHSQLMSIIRWREQFPMKSIPMLVCSQVKLA